MWDWMQEHAGWIVAVSVLSFLATLAVIPILLVRMPADYFLHRPRESMFAQLHPALRVIALTLKNVLGGFLVLAGLALSLPGIPGQGVLTILIGLTLLDIPGKRRMELAIVRNRRVLRGINWIRRKANRPPLELPPKRE